MRDGALIGAVGLSIVLTTGAMGSIPAHAAEKPGAGSVGGGDVYYAPPAPSAPAPQGPACTNPHPTQGCYAVPAPAAPAPAPYVPPALAPQPVQHAPAPAYQALTPTYAPPAVPVPSYVPPATATSGQQRYVAPSGVWVEVPTSQDGASPLPPLLDHGEAASNADVPAPSTTVSAVKVRSGLTYGIWYAAI